MRTRAIRHRLIQTGLCFLFFTVLVPSARSGAPNVGCSAPFVFSDAAVNVVILPYTYSGASEKPLSATGQRLSALIYLNTLFSILKFESVGAVQLVAPTPHDKAECTDAAVLDKLLDRRPGARAQLRPGNGVVMVWGRIYEESGEIYVQSFVRFQRRDLRAGDGRESISFQVGRSEFKAELASQALTFPPRKLSTKDLDDIQQEFVRSAGVRDTPDANAPSKALPIDSSPFAPPFAYRIVQTQGDWMKVEPFESLGPSGWIHAGFGADRWPLRDKMPELSFIQGLAGYLAFRRSIASTAQDNSAAKFLAKVNGAFREYDRASEGQPRALASAVEKQIIGILKVRNSGGSGEMLLSSQISTNDIKAASLLFTEAYELIPESAAAMDTKACGELWTNWVAQQMSPSEISKIADDLVAAVALDPKDETTLGNLENFYDLVISSRGSRPELVERRNAVARLHESLRAAPNR